MVSRPQDAHRSSQRDNFSETKISGKAHIAKGYRYCENLPNVLNFKGNAHAKSICTKMVCIGHFQRNLKMSFLRMRFTCSGYWSLYIPKNGNVRKPNPPGVCAVINGVTILRRLFKKLIKELDAELR